MNKLPMEDDFNILSPVLFTPFQEYPMSPTMDFTQHVLSESYIEQKGQEQPSQQPSQQPSHQPSQQQHQPSQQPSQQHVTSVNMNKLAAPIEQTSTQNIDKYIDKLRKLPPYMILQVEYITTMTKKRQELNIIMNEYQHLMKDLANTQNEFTKQQEVYNREKEIHELLGESSMDFAKESLYILSDIHRKFVYQSSLVGEYLDHINYIKFDISMIENRNTRRIADMIQYLQCDELLM